MLTPGEVLQLPATDALVMMAGMPPIRARKLKYFNDRQFLDRQRSAPALNEDAFQDLPPHRADDWQDRQRSIDRRLDTGWTTHPLSPDEDHVRARALPKKKQQPGKETVLPLFAGIGADIGDPNDTGSGSETRDQDAALGEVLEFPGDIKLS